MRLVFSIIYMFLIILLIVCAITANSSGKKNGKSVAALLGLLIPPVIGNLIIIRSGDPFLSTIGCYIYFLGMTVVMFALVNFTFHYCRITWPNRLSKIAVYLLLITDIIQILCNPFFGHAFSIQPIEFDGYAYYVVVAHLGQSFHRLAVYSVFIMVLIIFFVKMIRSPKIYSERFSVILITMVIVGLWETYYIFSRTPIDRSMIGFAVFGFLVFYFTLYYRPLRLLDRMLSNVAQQMQESLFFFDAAGHCIWVNQPGMLMSGVANDDYDAAAAELRRRFGELGEGQEEWSLQFVSGSDENASFYVMQRHTIKDSKGRADGSFLSIRDNTEDQRALKRERYNATHDNLTGLYTKEHLYARIRQLLAASPDTPYLIIFLNVNGFKIVNDIFGNDFGDYVLRRIADQIRSYCTPNCAYGRLGGDTFGICVPACEFPEKELEKVLSNFVVSNGNIEQKILVHLGVYRVTCADIDVSVMFDRARMALSTIREAYQTYIAYYNEEMREQVLWSQKISSQLLDALEQKQIVPYLQPMVNAEGKVVGAEALVRWIHPEEGFLPPVRFIPVFEKNGMIAEVDRYMWRCACEILARWKKEGRDLFISVNISPRDFYFMDVAAELRNAVQQFDVEPSQMRIEITETVMMTDIDNRVQMLEELKEEGFYVEMDDFGSGYSSLNLLKDMPVDLIKIDMMFLEKSKDGGRAQTILHNIISMSDELGISTLTEGVETQAQYKMLTGMGCRLFQGYYFAKPMPVEEFEEFCKASNCEKK